MQNKTKKYLTSGNPKHDRYLAVKGWESINLLVILVLSSVLF